MDNGPSKRQSRLAEIREALHEGSEGFPIYTSSNENLRLPKASAKGDVKTAAFHRTQSKSITKNTRRRFIPPNARGVLGISNFHNAAAATAAKTSGPVTSLWFLTKSSARRLWILPGVSE